MQENPTVYFHVWGIDNIAYGPVELPTLVDWVRQGRVLHDTWVYQEHKSQWGLAGQMAELKILFKSKQGTPPSTDTHGLTTATLRRMKILADMDERQLNSFLQYMEVVSLLPNAVVFKKGEAGDAMFLVLQGEVRARVMVSGRETTLATLGVGECVGELAVIDESPRSADVVANVESILLKISASALKKLFGEAPALAAPFLLALSKTITGRIRATTKRYEDSVLFARGAGQS